MARIALPLAPTRQVPRWLLTALASVSLIALVIWLWQFRFGALLRHMGAGYVVSRAPLVPVDSAPLWLQPFYSTLNYLNTTWETTLAALLIAGTLQTFYRVPLLRLIRTHSGWRAYLAGIALGLPNLFCTCCAAPLFAGLYRKGTSLGSALATFITAPSLNIVVVLLAFAFLPLPLALARVGLGLVAVIAVPYLAARLAGVTPPPVAQPEIEETFEWNRLARTWISNIWGMVRLALPLLILGYFLVSVFQIFVPIKTIAPTLGNGFLPVVLVALVGTIIMVPTFSEIALVAALVPLGMGIGPAVALLITAPAVSLPSLIVVGRATRSIRVPVAVFSLVLGLGILAGWIALLV